MNNRLKKSGELPMKVSKEVVGHLSIRMYKNFARAIKELISNSYDAKATETKIKLDLKNSRIIVRDNGEGMNLSEIREQFLNIGHPTSLSEKENKIGRKRIGTFGIGFLSIFPYCDKMLIITKKENRDEIAEIEINTAQFFKKGSFLIREVKIPYKLYKSDLPNNVGETIIILEGIKQYIISELREKPKGKASLEKLGGYLKFVWTLAQYCPIEFSPKNQILKGFFYNPKRIPLDLWIDGIQIFRNIPKNAIILEKGNKDFGKISVKFAIMTPKKPVEPEESRGLQIRLRDVGIGFPTDFDVIKYSGKVLGKLNYLCGEIHILSGLDTALMIDRDNFSYTQEVADFEEFFRQRLTKWNNELEKWAESDKEVYSSLKDLEDSESIAEELRKAEIIHLDKNRLRIPKKAIVSRKKGKITLPVEKTKKALSKRKDYKIISKTGVSKKPIEILPKKKEIVIYEDHPDFIEEIKVQNRKFTVSYDEWDPDKTEYSICKISKDEKGVIYNKSHPLFMSKLSEEIIKKLSLGILLIVKGRKDERELLRKMNCLIEQLFTI